MSTMSERLWGTYVVAKREFFMNLKSIRMIILMVIFTLFILFAAYVGSFLMGFVSGIPEAGGNIENGPVLIVLFVVQFISFIGPIIAIALAFDVIVKEKIQNSLGLLLCRPVSKRSIALGKFLGMTSALALPVLLVNLLAIGIIMGVSGKGISIEQTVGFLLLTLVFLATYLALAQLISSVVKTTTTAILAGLVVWFAFWLFLPIIGYFINSNMISLVSPGTSYSACMSSLLGMPEARPLVPLWGYYGIMFVWFIGVIIVAVEMFHWKEE